MDALCGLVSRRFRIRGVCQRRWGEAFYRQGQVLWGLWLGLNFAWVGCLRLAKPMPSPHHLAPRSIYAHYRPCIAIVPRRSHRFGTVSGRRRRCRRRNQRGEDCTLRSTGRSPQPLRRQSLARLLPLHVQLRWQCCARPASVSCARMVSASPNAGCVHPHAQTKGTSHPHRGRCSASKQIPMSAPRGRRRSKDVGIVCGEVRKSLTALSEFTIVDTRGACLAAPRRNPRKFFGGG